MKLKAWFKSKTADKVLFPIRDLIIENIPCSSSVFEIGCGTGDLLIKASDKISRGVGIDKNSAMIEFANSIIRNRKYANLQFHCIDANEIEYHIDERFDISTATLCLHEMEVNRAIKVMKLMSNISNTMFIADYTKPDKMFEKISLEVDEMVSGHYANFKEYRINGGLPYLAKMSGLEISKYLATPFESITIWQIDKR